MEGLEMVARDSLFGESIDRTNSDQSGRAQNEEAALSYFSDIVNTDDDERNWSFPYLRKQLLVKDSSALFRRYQKRVQHALFVEMLLINLLVNAAALCALLSPKPNIDTSDDQLKEEEFLMFSFRFTRVLNLVAQGFLFLLAFFRERWFNGCLAATITMMFVLIGEMGTELAMAIKMIPRDTPGSYTRSFTYYIVFTSTVLLSSPRKRSTAIAAVVLIIVDQAFAISSYVLASKTSPTETVNLVVAEAVFLVVTLLVGILLRYLIEVMGRRAFLDRRDCLDSKMKIENEKDREEKLLQSVLPKHIAKEVREDISKVVSTMTEHLHLPRKPFKKLYVDRYEDVSILYADIVNSMLLGASLCVSDLVDTLNDLFGRFDEAAQNYGCMRIKLLGDCYYCISGLQSNYGEDTNEIKRKNIGHHSDNCVRTGLKMIYIIKQIRENRDIDVDMRIGVHSGNVLGGLLGLRKWQFDIWSKDVTIASHMEQSGVPGHVHITRATRDLLQEDYIIKPGDGHLRDPYLDAEGIRTFLIVPPSNARPNKVLMQISMDSSRMTEDGVPRLPRRTSSSTTGSFQRDSSQGYYDRQSSDRVGFIPKRRRHVLDYSLVDFRKMVEQTNKMMERAINKMSLSKRDQWCSSVGIQPFLLTFQEGMEMERLYHKQPDPLFKYYMLCALLIFAGITIIHLLLLPHTLGFWIMFSVTLVVVLLAGFASWAGYIEQLIFKKDDTIRIRKSSTLLKMSRGLWKTTSTRVSIMIIVCFLILSCSLIGIKELLKVPNRFDNSTALHLNGTRVLHSVNLSPDVRKHFYTFCVVLALTGTTVFLRIHFLLKLALKASAIATFCKFYLVDMYSEKAYFYPNREAFGGSRETSLCFYLIFVGIILHLVDRQVEYICRQDFVWRTRLQREQEETTRVELVNRVLLRNILPRHVASHYLNAQNQRTPEPHYHEECSSVAILFASIPSFANFYIETDLNEAGKRCIQFLNEIVCDFDQLLIEKFPMVEKIKTIGSTYMAACGLHTGNKDGFNSYVPSAEEESTEQDKKRNNVATLARFSIAMMATLNVLNRDAMQEFQIRAGIAVGRVMAGVVGTVKPQYDIWGDAVNVASRMDSTGIPGRTQITEEVADLLKDTGSFETECRGEIVVKGKGKLTTFFLKTPHDQPEFEETQL